MIMAGRGRRLANVDNETKIVGIPPTLPENSSVASLVPIIKKINDINMNDINPLLLTDVQNELKQLFTSKKVLREILSELHSKALSDAEFGEKLVVSLEQISNYEVDGVILRGDLLSFIQDDFKMKETLAESDAKTFLNSVMLLGNIYNRFKVCGAPITILGIALIECFDLLLKGSEEELKTLVKQILINGTKLSDVNKYELLIQNIRNTLITECKSSSSKCWLLLAIDLISNDFKPFKKIIDDFYVNRLGEDYVKLKAFGKVHNQQNLSSSDYFSFDSPKSEDSSSSEKKNTNLLLNKPDGSSKNLSKKLFDLNIKPDFGVKTKVQSPTKNFRKESWKPKGVIKESSGHDDRFEREENFYGVQKPRQMKPENHKKKFSDSKSSNKQFDNFKIEVKNKPEIQPQTTTEESWN